MPALHVALGLVAIASAASAVTPTPAVQAFLDAHDGMTAMFYRGKMIALFGVPIDVVTDVNATAQQLGS